MLIRLNTRYWKGRWRLPEKEKLLLIGAFAAVYVIWGSTYLSIKIAVTTLPPFLMAGTRYLLAGLILFGAAFLTGSAKPSLNNWKDSAILGFFLLLMGNGGVVWASGKLPSGIIALLVTIEPIWVILLVWLRKQEKMPGVKAVAGMVLGFAGAVVLLAPGNLSEGVQIDFSGLVAIVISTFCWAVGSLYAVKADTGNSAFMATGMQMLTGGIFMIVVAVLRNEIYSVNPASVSAESVIAFLYLIIFGSIVGYTAYAYLLKVADPGKVATYAYVNPFVAVILGTLIGNEVFTLKIAFAGLLLLAGVILVLSEKQSK